MGPGKADSHWWGLEIPASHLPDHQPSLPAEALREGPGSLLTPLVKGFLLNPLQRGERGQPSQGWGPLKLPSLLSGPLVGEWRNREGLQGAKKARLCALE